MPFVCPSFIRWAIDWDWEKTTTQPIEKNMAVCAVSSKFLSHVI